MPAVDRKSSNLPYEEPTFRIDSESITIRRYYFPLGTAKTISVDQIRSVSVRPTNWSTRLGREGSIEGIYEFTETQYIATNW